MTLRRSFDPQITLDATLSFGLGGAAAIMAW
jgi:hypothetical protein